MLTCIPRLIAMEELVGADLGHSDALVAGHRLLEQAEGPPETAGVIETTSLCYTVA